jgi:hypothetical protein
MGFNSGWFQSFLGTSLRLILGSTSKTLIYFSLFSGSFSWATADKNELPVFDHDFVCTTQEKADQYIRDFKIDTNSFGGRDLCNSKVDIKKLFNDLQIIELGQFDLNYSSIHKDEDETSAGNSSDQTAINPLIGGFIDTKNYYPWMRDQTEGMNRGNDVPYATAYNSFGYFTMQDGWATLSTLGRVGTVIHEARHTAGITNDSPTGP